MTTPIEITEERKPFLEHIEDLRRCVFHCAAVIFLFTLGCFFVSESIVYFLVLPALDSVESLHYFAPAEAFLIRIKAALLAGTILSLPVVLPRVWAFVSPGLYAKEKSRVLLWGIIASGLFLSGVAFCYHLVLPLAIQFLSGFSTPTIQPVLSAGEYIAFSLSMVTAFGIAFNLPIFIVLICQTGLSTPASLARYRRHSWVGSFVVAMLLTPPDMISQILLALPLIVLFEAGLLAARILQKK